MIWPDLAEAASSCWLDEVLLVHVPVLPPVYSTCVPGLFSQNPFLINEVYKKFCINPKG